MNTKYLCANLAGVLGADEHREILCALHPEEFALLKYPSCSKHIHLESD